MTAANRRILVLDDDREVRSLIAAVLRQRGLLVDEAEGGQQAIDLLEVQDYAVVLIDLLMPQPDGFAVVRSLEGRPPRSAPVVLVLTGADRSVVDRLEAQHIHGVVRKPFDPEELAALVEACSEIRSRTSFEMMAVAVISGARVIDLLSKL